MKPYTYLIGWTKHKKYYYGVRYAKDCDPSDLWKKYFTSSKTVKSFRQTHGEPDIIEIRKTFSAVEVAREWEHTVLIRMNVVLREDFLNENDRPAPPIRYGKRPAYVGEKISKALKGQPKSKEHIQNMLTKFESGHNPWNKGKVISDETKQKISETLTGRSMSEDTKQKMSDNHRSKNSNYEFKQSDEAKYKISKTLTGRKLTEETKQKMRGPRGNHKIINCPHCNKQGGISAIKRWHFDNCKEKK